MTSNIERKARRKRQTRLTFDPVLGTGSAPNTPAKVRYSLRGQKPTPRPGSSAVTEHDSDESEDSLSSDSSALRKSSQKTTNRGNNSKLPVKALATAAKSLQVASKDAPFDIMDSDFDEMLIASHQIGNPKSQSRKRSAFNMDSDATPLKITKSSDQGMFSSGTRYTTPQRFPKPNDNNLSTTNGESNTEDECVLDKLGSSVDDNLSATKEELDSEDSEPIILSSRKLSRSTQLPADDDEGEDKIISPLLKGRRSTVISSDGDESDAVSPVKRYKPQPLSESASESTGRFTRQHRKKGHRTAKEKQLEILKRKRSGRSADLTPSEIDSDDDRDDRQLGHLSDFDDEDEDEELPVRRKTKPEQQKIHDDEAEDEDAFIVEDVEENLGIPAGIPLEFTRHYNKPEKEHFQDAVEWLINKKLNPGYTGNKELYERAFIKLNDKPQTLRASKYGSSQWTAAFNYALDARPEYRERFADGSALCEPCNHNKHPITYAITLTGKAYDRDTLEEIEQDSEEEDSDNMSVDGQGHQLTRQGKEWLSGRFCRDKAKKAHLLSHWKYHLYEWVLGTLESEGELTPEKLVARDRMKPRVRRKYVEEVVSRWKEDGQLKGLYENYNTAVSNLAEEGADSRWGRK